MTRFISGYALAALCALTAAVAANGRAPLTAVSGRVVSVDPAAQTLIVKLDHHEDSPIELVFVVDPRSMILKSGSLVPLSALKAGDAVSVTYRWIDGRNRVRNIGVAAEPKT